jgi:hypothetical protein
MRYDFRDTVPSFRAYGQHCTLGCGHDDRFFVRQNHYLNNVLNKHAIVTYSEYLPSQTAGA